MEHESFEKEDVASVMNKHFVNIKGNHLLQLFICKNLH